MKLAIIAAMLLCAVIGVISAASHRSILGVFFCVLGLMFMKGAAWSLDHPAPPLGFRVAGWLGWCLGFIAVGYGALLLLSLLRPIALLD